jgi:flagellar export protein FliJ
MRPSSKASGRLPNYSPSIVMAGFRFRLASVLRLREQIKNQKQIELRAVYETRQSILAEIETLEQALSANALNSAAGIFTAMELHLRAEHSQALAKQIRSKHTALAACNDALAVKRAELVEAMRRVKSLQKLRLRHQEHYWREQNAAEQKFADEIAQRKFTQPRERKKIPN